jgi:integral membrane protein
MGNTPIGRIRAIGTVEALSFLILLLIAMPLKYAADIPEAVMVVGIAHGFFFSLYILALLNALFVRKLTFKQSVIGFICALLPFGPFVFDRKLRKLE